MKRRLISALIKGSFTFAAILVLIYAPVLVLRSRHLRNWSNFSRLH